MKIFIWIIKLVLLPIKSMISVLRVLPPYKIVQGRLVDKSKNDFGEYHILVDQQLISVDEITMSTLVVGEALKLTMTRDNRAIEINNKANASDGDEGHQLIREFIKAQEQSTRVFIDELPISQKDLKSLIAKDTELEKTLKVLVFH